MTSIPVAQPLDLISKLFNNQDYSDCAVQFPKRKLLLHKNILCAHSNFFRAWFAQVTKETREGVIKIDDDENLMEELLKSLYTGRIEMEKQSDNVPMILLAQKYQFTSLIPALVDTLVNNMDDSNVLHCSVLNLEDDLFQGVRQKMSILLRDSADAILRGDSYLTLNSGQLLSVLSVLVNEKNTLEAFYAIHSWIKLDEKNRGSKSVALMDVVTKMSKVPHQTTSIIAAFDPQFCEYGTEFSQNNKRIIKFEGKTCVAYGTKCDTFSVRLIRNCRHLKVGMAPRTNGRRREGFYFDVKTGKFDAPESRFRRSRRMGHGDGMVIHFSLKNGELNLLVNGQFLDVGFRDLSGFDLYPSFILSDDGCEFEFL